MAMGLGICDRGGERRQVLRPTARNLREYVPDVIRIRIINRWVGFCFFEQDMKVRTAKKKLKRPQLSIDS